MQLLRQVIHPSLGSLKGKQFTRETARAIVTKGEQILLLYTERYDDYSLPGGGIDNGESIEQGLKRELHEETGAQQISVNSTLGLYEEYRPWYKDDFDIIHIRSHCYFCTIGEQLLTPKMEHYEQQNGMQPKWVNIQDAISHNETTMALSAKQGLSIQRETYLLKEIAKQL
ncbi:NUDIX hydrolase [Pseudoalteromonas mariniglutinosa]|uniref:NUDIX hydrolase n=1 Tax=Pseudoalteromonas mariniglutinosa TaxID=206042 RepID=UPI00384FA970